MSEQAEPLDGEAVLAIYSASIAWFGGLDGVRLRALGYDVARAI